MKTVIATPPTSKKIKKTPPKNNKKSTSHTHSVSACNKILSYFSNNALTRAQCPDREKEMYIRRIDKSQKLDASDFLEFLPLNSFSHFQPQKALNPYRGPNFLAQIVQYCLQKKAKQLPS